MSRWMTLLLVVVSIARAGAAELDPASIERRAITERSRVERGDVEVMSEGWMVDGNMKTTSFAYKIRIVFDGKKIRNDIFRPLDLDLSFVAGSWRTTLCFGETDHIFYTEQSDVIGNKIMMNVIGLDKFKPVSDMKCVDPRYLGLNPAGAMNARHSSVDSYLNQDKLVSTESREEPYQGQRCYVTTKTRTNGVQITSWILPDRQWVVAKIETRFASGGRPQIHSIETDYALHQPSGVWFPSGYRHRVTDGDRETQHDDLTVKVHQLGSYVDPVVFTVADMNIPVGTGVLQSPTKLQGFLYWDGLKVASTLTPKAPPTDNRRFALIAGVGTGVIIAAFLMYRLTRRSASRRNSASPSV